MFKQKTLWDTIDAISSLASEAGNMPCSWPAGRKTGPSGPAPAPASHSPPPADEKALKTADIFGRNGCASSESAALQSFLESRLRQALDTNGSMLFSLTWREKVMPSGRRIYRLHASGHRMSDKDCGLSHWEKTPHGSDGIGGVMEIRPGTKGHYKLRDFVHLASWPTCRGQDSYERRN